MGIVPSKEKIKHYLEKYKCTILVLIIGLMLILMPSISMKEENVQAIQQVDQDKCTINDELEAILTKIHGVGDVQVYLTIAVGEKTIYQTDEEKSVHTDSSSSRIETVIMSNADRGEYGLIHQVTPPEYLGALIVCQGADNPAVRLSIVDAVSKLTGLGANKISVLKMK